MNRLSLDKLKQAIKKNGYEFSETSQGIEISKFKSDFAYYMTEFLNNNEYVVRLSNYGSKFYVGEKYKLYDIQYNEGEDEPPTDLVVLNSKNEEVTGSIYRFIPLSWVKEHKSNKPEWL